MSRGGWFTRLSRIGPLKRAGLFGKVFVAIIIGFFFIGLAVSAASDWQLDRSLTHEYQTKGEAIARSIAGSAVELLLTRDASTIQSAIDQYLEIPGVAYVFVADDRGEIISHTFVPTVPAEMRAIASERTESFREDARVTELSPARGGDFIDIGVPILAGVAGSVHVGMDRAVIRATIRGAVYRLQAILAGFLVVMLGIAYVFVKRTAQPLKGLTTYVQQLGHGEFGDAASEPAVRAMADAAEDEVGELARAFINMQRELAQHLKMRDELVGLRRELEIASTIQQQLLPKTAVPGAMGSGLDIFAEMIPAKEIGGDFYDFFPLGDGKLALVVADVSGKGVPAALFMAVSRTLLKATALRGVGPGECLRQLNDLLCVDSGSEMFVTVCYGVLDLNNGTLDYATGGHYAPIHVRRSGEAISLPRANGLVIGMMEDIDFQSHSVTLTPGDAIMLFTDGVTEAMDEDGSLFSLERLTHAVGEAHASSSRQLAEVVIERVRRFAGTAEQVDDITVLTLTYLGASPAS